MKKLLIKFLETEMLNVNSKDYAFSLSVKDRLICDATNLSFTFIINAEDNESGLVYLFLTKLYSFYFANNFNPEKLNYQINKLEVNECTNLKFNLLDEINF
jgi:hypothetical protein